MRRNVCVFLTPALLDYLLEEDRAFELLQAQHRVTRLDRFRSFAITVFPNDAVDRHTASYQLEAAIPAFDEFCVHSQPPSVYRPRISSLTPRYPF